MTELKKLVIDKIGQLGIKESCAYFGVSAGTVSNWASGKTMPTLSAAQTILTETAGDPQPIETVAVPQEIRWEGRKLMVLMPVYRSVNPKTHQTLFANYAKYGPEKIGIMIEEKTVIHESRNILIHKAMETDAEYFLFVDDDVILPCGNAGWFNGLMGAGVSDHSAGSNAITRIMSYGPEVEIVGGLYFGRHARGRAQNSLGFTSDQANQEFRTPGQKGLREVEWVATGFMRIHRSAIEKMKQSIDAGKFPEAKPSDLGMSNWYGYFNPKHVGIGEDVSFCSRANEIGIKCYVDAGLVLLHEGSMLWGPSTTK